jgi:hypothetical protein
VELELVDVVLVLDEVDAGIAPVLVVANSEGVLMIFGGLVKYVTGEIWPLIDWPKPSLVVTLNVFEPLPSGTMML